MFRQRVPVDVLLTGLREQSDRTVMAVLAALIERGAHTSDLVISAEQKQSLRDLWAAIAFVAGARCRKGNTQRLFLAALRAEADADPLRAEAQRLAEEMFSRTQHLDLQSQANAEEVFDAVFGSGTFSYDGMAGRMGVELASCIRCGDFICERYKF